MQTITNTELAKRMGEAHSKVRRWAREFLPPDPKATLRSGYRKEYSLNEAWIISLGGALVSMGFLVPEARKIIDDLHPWLESKGLWPEVEGYFSESKKDEPQVTRYEIRITRSTAPGGFEYEAIGIVRDFVSVMKDGSQIMVDGLPLLSQEFIVHHIALPEDGSVTQALTTRTLQISFLLHGFLVKMLGDERFMKWWNSR